MIHKIIRIGLRINYLNYRSVRLAEIPSFHQFFIFPNEESAAIQDLCHLIKK